MLPIRNHNVQWSNAQDRCHTANQRVLIQIEKNKRGAGLAECTGGKWKLDDENLAEHQR